MPWWGWLLIALAAVVIAPIKIKIMKKMLNNKKTEEQIEED